MSALGNGRRRHALLPLVGIVIAVVYLFPVYWMVNTSLKPESEVFRPNPDLVPQHPTLAPYRAVLVDNANLLHGLGNSLVIATGTTVVTLLLAVPAAYGLARLRIPFTSTVLLLLLVVQMIPSVNLALPLFVLFSKLHLVNTYAGLIVANCSLALPLAVVVLRPYCLTVPGEVLDAARADGCTDLSVLWRMVLPITAPGVTTTAVITFLGAWGEYVFALSLATEPARQPATVVLAGLNSILGTQWNNVMAASTIIAVPVLVLFLALQRFVVAGLTEGATKA